MIRLARSERVKRTIGGLVTATPLARRFVGGDSAAAAVATARRLRDEIGISASLFYLGEYVSESAVVEQTVVATLAAVELLGAAGLDVHVSVDPTAIGQMASEELCAENADRLARAVAAYPDGRRNALMLDMEDLSLLEPTLRLHDRLIARGLPAAVTLQARLRRTESDLRSLLGRTRAIRLVKGAFPLGPAHDHQGRAAITDSYLRLAEAMLSAQAQKSGLYPVFATHDDLLAERISILARTNGWRPDQYEFEMLYGVRPRWQRQLRAQGLSVRVYLPFGTDWWAYAIRRLGENPRNLLLLAPLLFHRDEDRSRP
jgi:proline dehydrogenase